MEEKLSHSLEAYIERQPIENLKSMWVDCRLGRSANGVMGLVKDALRRKGCAMPFEYWERTDDDGQPCDEQQACTQAYSHRLFLRS